MWIEDYDKLVESTMISIELETALPDGKKTLDVLVGIFEPPSFILCERWERRPHYYENILYVIKIKIYDKTWTLHQDFFPSGGVKFDEGKTAAQNWVSSQEVLSQARDRMSEIAQKIQQKEDSDLWMSGVPLEKWLFKKRG